MARNKSEKIPHPELHADVHRYYNARWGTSGEDSTRLHHGFSHEIKEQINRNWWGPLHDVLVNFYKEQRRAKSK